MQEEVFTTRPSIPLIVVSIIRLLAQASSVGDEEMNEKRGPMSLTSIPSALRDFAIPLSDRGVTMADFSPHFRNSLANRIAGLTAPAVVTSGSVMKVTFVMTPGTSDILVLFDYLFNPLSICCRA